MNHTQNYQLSQWAKSDQVKMEDFNADNAKIDAALKAQATAQTAMQTALNHKGNCSINLFTYTGTGTYGPANPTRITFPRRPTAFIVLGGSAILIADCSQNWVAVQTFVSAGGIYANALPMSWSGSTCSFYAIDNSPHYQANHEVQYSVIAFYAES